MHKSKANLLTCTAQIPWAASQTLGSGKTLQNSVYAIHYPQFTFVLVDLYVGFMMRAPLIVNDYRMYNDSQTKLSTQMLYDIHIAGRGTERERERLT